MARVTSTRRFRASPERRRLIFAIIRPHGVEERIKLYTSHPQTYSNTPRNRLYTADSTLLVGSPHVRRRGATRQHAALLSSTHTGHLSRAPRTRGNNRHTATEAPRCCAKLVRVEALCDTPPTCKFMISLGDKRCCTDGWGVHLGRSQGLHSVFE